MSQPFFMSTIQQATGGGLNIVAMNFQNSPNGVGGFNGVDFCEGSGLWTICGERSTGGRIYHSSDGVTWTLSTYPVDRLFMRPANDGTSSILAARNTGGQTTSINQTNWTAITVPLNNYQQAIYGGGVWLLFRGGDPARSTNRTTWATVVGTGLLSQIGKPAFGGGNFVKAEATGGLYTSTDGGLTWSQTKTGGATEQYFQVDYNPDSGLFLAFSINNLITTSSDNGLTWSTPITGPLLSTATKFDRLGYGGGMWIYMSNNATAGNNFWYSRNDGATWEPSPVAVPVGNWFDIHYSDTQQKFIAVMESASPTNVILEIVLG